MPLTNPQFHDLETQLQPDQKRILTLLTAKIPDNPDFTFLELTYRWEKGLNADEVKRLTLRALAFISCSIYDAAIAAGLNCRLSPMPYKRQPAWLLEDEISPVSIILSNIDETNCTCQMTIGEIVMLSGEQSFNQQRWSKIANAYITLFHQIFV